MITFKRTNSDNIDFLNLIKELDYFLNERDTTAHTACKPYNATETIKHVIVAYNELGEAIGCGAIRKYTDETMEVKRMYVKIEQRRKKYSLSNSNRIRELDDRTRRFNMYIRNREQNA